MTTLCQITMDGGDGIIGSTIKWHLKNYAHYFERVIVVDGNLTNKAKEFYQQFPNLIALDRPWKDSYVAQYRAFADELKDDEWALYLDDDEICSAELLDYVNHKNFPFGSKNDINMFYIPCILYLTENGKDYYPAEPLPKINFEGQWTKHILFKKEKSLDFKYFGSHVIATHHQNEKADYIHWPYFHMKTLESFVYNDVWQAFLSPEGQGYTKQEADLFRALTKQYKSTKEFKKATVDGKWTFPLQKFAYSYKSDYDRPISRLSWVYWTLLGHSYPFPTKDRPSWDVVKQFVLSQESMNIFIKNKTQHNKLIIE